MAHKAKERTYTKEEMAKAIDESFALGVKAGSKHANLTLIDPKLEAEMQITSLFKTMDANGRKINKVILERHRESVIRQMKAWRQDADAALEDVLKLAHQHGAINEPKSDKSGS